MEIGHVGESALTAKCSPRQLTVEERLIQQKTELESRLKDVNAALEALQANPEILKVLSLISKVHY